jgi:Family of unknown function (DUF5681)
MSRSSTLSVAEKTMTKKDSKTTDYPVGKGKPPVKNQFAKGVSGNLAGRPKGSGSLAYYLEREGRRKVRVVEDGRPRMASNDQLSARQLNRKAAQGDLKAISLKIQSATKFTLLSEPNASSVLVPTLSAEALRRAAEACLRDLEDEKDEDADEN